MSTFLYTKSHEKPYFKPFQKSHYRSTILHTNSTNLYTQNFLFYIFMYNRGVKCRMRRQNVYIFDHHFYPGFHSSLYPNPLLSTRYMLFYSSRSTLYCTAAYSYHHSFLQFITHDTTFSSTKYPRKPLFIVGCYLLNNESIVVIINNNSMFK